MERDSLFHICEGREILRLIVRVIVQKTNTFSWLLSVESSPKALIFDPFSHN
jgi:hypothetical protein